MILLDTNILLYSFGSSLLQHGKAQTWLDRSLNGSVRVGMPWSSLIGFVRIASNPRAFEKAVSVAEAWAVVEAWLDCPVVWVPTPAEAHRAILGRMFHAIGNRKHLVQDAHVAALAIEHDLTLCTTDGDFARFPGLRWENPLQR